ncbi:MAG: extracellular solute-binding protein [Bdellovibrionaceae bacterium]|jgi:iron(III) transport system substrate-binding protein|nr:extracellular solute-binding protein [Pseudobdellovibrionaceae bacterium]
MKINIVVALILSVFAITSCTKKSADQTVWIYTSLYKDTIADIQPQLEKEFPGVKFSFYQAGSEDVAAKVQAENMAGKIQADVLVFSDRFWFEGMASQGKLLNYKPANSEKVAEPFKNSDGAFTTVSYPIMVLAYNSDVIPEKDAPKSFKELTNAKWKGKVSTGSPLASGTTFTTVAFLAKAYGWDYFKDLRKNDLIAEGGNSGVIRRLQSKERPVGIVLLENILRLTTTDPRIKQKLPEDGAVVQSNVLAIVKKEGEQALAKKVADWFFAQKGQEAMAKSFMYPSVPGHAGPVGAPEFSVVMKSAPAWSKDFVKETIQSRDKIKDEFSKIVF